jgi:hypothetical protein
VGDRLFHRLHARDPGVEGELRDVPGLRGQVADRPRQHRRQPEVGVERDVLPAPQPVLDLVRHLGREHVARSWVAPQPPLVEQVVELTLVHQKVALPGRR